MAYFFDDFKRDWIRERFQEKLVNDRYYFDLDLIHLATFSDLYLSSLTRIVPDEQINAEANTPQAHEVTLQYLYQLLKEGKLKMRRVIQPDDPEDTLSMAGITNRSGPVPIRTYATAEEAIADLRNMWNRPNNKYNIIDGIEISTHFTLPENEWVI